MLLVGLLAAPAIGFADPDPSAQRAASEAAAALRLSHSPRGAVHLIRLHALRDEVSDLNLFARTYLQLVNQRGAHPTVRALSRLFAADVERGRGKLNRADELIRSLGYFRDFYVLGSFDNEGKAGCGTDFGPESRLDLKASYPMKTQSAGWRKLTVAAPDGYIDLAAALRPRHEVVGYALTFLKADQARRVNLALGASGAFRLWINGQLAASEDRYNLPRPDQARVAVQLATGMNALLLKVCQDSGPFGFYLRLEDGGESVKSSLPEPAAGPWPKGLPPKAERLPTLTSLLEREVRRRPDDAELRGEYASALAFLRTFDEREHADVAEAEQAAESAPGNVGLRLLAARLQEDDANLRRKHLELALKADPRSAEARLQLAQHELARGYPERALQPLEELTRETPRFAAARLTLGRARELLGEWPRAAALAESAFQDFPYLPSIAREAARVARRLDRNQEAVARLRVALAIRYDDAPSRRSLISLLTDMGRVDEAAQEMRLILRLDPFDNQTRLRLAELFSANARFEEAQGLFAEAKAVSPDEPEVYEREGRALLQTGRRTEALAAFEHSLQLRPQNPALRESWRLLKGEKSTPGTEYVFDLGPLAKEADSIAGEDSVYLVDYTYVRVQANGLSSRFQQTGVKVYSQRGVEAFRSFPITYSPDRQEVRILRATVTKPDGSVIESYSESERSLNAPWSRLYYDARAKVLSFPSLAPGDVLDVRYRLEDTALDNLLSDYWGDVDYVETVAPKLRYLYIADMPPGRALYWNKSLSSGIAEVEQTEQDGRTLYRWSAHHVPKVIPEPSMPGWAEVVPTLHVSTYKSWDQVGRYYWGLVRDQLRPNQELRRTVNKALVGVDQKNELAVIRAIYNFVVTNTRYVALEFGIHGYKPYRVDQVLARRFGDCKDKASLIYAMLKVAGIDSRLVLLRMRHLGSIGEEPASLAAFNHAIVFVPKHNLFLDGTAEFHSSRELPSSDRLANVLIVEPNGASSFLRTPEARAEDNSMRTLLEVGLQEDGSAQILGESIVAGQNAPEYRRSYQPAATRKAIFEQGWAQVFPGLSVQDVRLSDLGNLDSDVSLKYQLNVPRYAEALPHSLRFYPFGSARSYAQTYALLAERKYDLVLQHPWVNQYVFTYRLPDGFTPLELPADLTEETPYGRMRISHRIEGGKLVSRGEVALTKTRIQSGEYGPFRAFLGRIDQAFSRKIHIAARSGQTAQR
jgi:tetratricopeptide (TPR) repeat protein